MIKFLLSKLTFILFLIVQLLAFNVSAQPDTETRAVWVTTNYRLDWPSSIGNSELQRKELKKIFEDIKAKGFNTVYFQVRSSGTVLFNSKYESIPNYFSDTNNTTLNFDPSKYAIESAREIGLKIHAWVNMIRCYSRNGHKDFLNKNHVIKKHPGWIVEHREGNKTTYWLDPGLPETRKYLLNLVEEITVKYNFDGIQFDYLRYPGKNFDDQFSYSAYGKNQNIHDWRRDNINKILIDAKRVIKRLKPNMLIGAAPIGIYKNGYDYYALQGYSDVYQDSYFWLENDLVDYLVPQIYWGLKGKPNFIDISKTWLRNSFDKNIILGIGAFKPEVYSDLEEIIEQAQKSRAAGFAIFRYGDIKEIMIKVPARN
ncbi:MAG: family 10 glycosylhydrolase [Ignavibacteriae bacterium]|nr:hypothetical protein [Ignavibacteriota bacterium]NOG97785.1 family 10 glycosylhydrolase [Ignavibacteriota bacterium]